MRQITPLAGLVAVVLLAGCQARPVSDAATFGASVMYVNMKSHHARDSSYSLGRFVDGVADPQRPIATAGCGLWASSVVRHRGVIYLYAAENDCQGWHRVVLFTSRDGVNFRRVGVVVRTRDELRMPKVVYDGGRFHMWFTLDHVGLGTAVAYTSSRNGRQFARAVIKFRAGRGLHGLAVKSVFRPRRWMMFIEAYNRNLTASRPYLLTFKRPEQSAYGDPRRVAVEIAAPKLSPSVVCRHRGGWRALFTVYGAGGAQHGEEWTVGYAAPRPTGPWRIISKGPVLQMHAGHPMTSVENPAAAKTSAKPLACS